MADGNLEQVIVKDETFLGLLYDIFGDIISQQVPGSIVLLIVGVVLFREIIGAWLKWRTK